MIGTVKFFAALKCFGSIFPRDELQDLFFHVSECALGFMLGENEVESLTKGAGKDG